MFKPAVPILRSFDEAKAKEFYVDFLGFTVDFEHRFEPGMPLYMGISQGDCRIHLSEHFGDCAPGEVVRLTVARDGGAAGDPERLECEVRLDAW